MVLNSQEWKDVTKAIRRTIVPEGADLYERVTRNQILSDVGAALRALDA